MARDNLSRVYYIAWRLGSEPDRLENTRGKLIGQSPLENHTSYFSIHENGKQIDEIEKWAVIEYLLIPKIKIIQGQSG